MSEKQDPSGQEPTEPKGQEPNPADTPKAPAVPSEPQGGDDKTSETIAKLESMIADLRKENGEKRIANKDAQSRIEALESKIEAESKAAQSRVARAAIKAEVAEQGANPLVLRLIDASKIEFDADGEPTNVSELVKAELDANPVLKSKGGAKAGAPVNGGKGGRGPDTYTAADLANLSAEQVSNLTPEQLAAAAARK